jgi:hypothetical protein
MEFIVRSLTEQMTRLLKQLSRDVFIIIKM